MPLISVITPAVAGGSGDLEEAYESLLDQRDLGDWRWEWIVQEDGEQPTLTGALADDPRVSYGASASRNGPGVTRTLALQRVRGSLVRCLDADDVLLPRGLAVGVELLEQYECAAWAVVERIEFAPTTATVDATPNTQALAEGLVPVGVLARRLEADDHFPIHCAGLTIRTAVLRAFGGWSALPRSEDTTMIAAINALFPGAYSREPTFVYRRMEDSLSAEQWSRNLLPTCRSILWQRLAAMEEIGLKVAGNTSGAPEADLW